MKTQFRDPTNRIVATLPGLAALSDLPIEDATGWTLETIIEADDVRAEASRRMQEMFGARDAGHLAQIISNANREAVRLLRKGEPNWSAEDAVRAAQLEAADLFVEAVRVASNAMEHNPPEDYAHDKYWPPTNKNGST